VQYGGSGTHHSASSHSAVTPQILHMYMWCICGMYLQRETDHKYIPQILHSTGGFTLNAFTVRAGQPLNAPQNHRRRCCARR
jgi:hypothetical protein